MTTRESKPVLERLFGTSKPIIGMVHVLPLPGSPYYRNGSLAQVYEQAVEEALILEEGGVDGILLENAGDIPFLKPDDIGFETIGGMSVIGDRVRRATKLPLGFNIVANAAKASLACAKSSGAQFVRVNQWANAYVANEGIVEGAASQAMRYRRALDGEDIVVLADVHVKHGSHAIVGDRPDAPGSKTRRKVEVEDIARTLVRFENGCTGCIQANWVESGRKMRHDFEISGSKGGIAFSQERFNELELYLTGDARGRSGFRKIFAGPEHEPYGNFCVAAGHQIGFNDLKTIEVRDFLRAIAGEEVGHADFREGLEVQRTIEAIYRSARSRAWRKVG